MHHIIQWTRRKFLKAASAIGALTMSPFLSNTAASNALAAVQPATMLITLHLNGVIHTLDIDPRATLLDTLRERLGLTGAKKGCDRGECGACTVHVNGRRINACMTLAVMQEGKEITTIEGLAAGEALHPVQAAFIEYDAFCAFNHKVAKTAMI
jgi:xanthine dehydrogenase YagT iron-sulfur-binding subunit